MTWDWDHLKGTPYALKFARRDLPCLDAVVARTPGRTAVVQAGGSIGIFPKRLAMSFQTVYTFEPSPEVFPVLCRNAPEANIVRYQAALGDTRGLVGCARVRRDGSRGPIHEGLTHIAGPGVVPTLRIDDLALPVCDLIYLDVEGFELYALRGAVETMLRCRPVLAVEANQNIGFYGLTVHDLHAFILSLDYQLVDRQQSDDVFVPRERAA
ncbi:MAG: FkbM family methyltransferase [Betaproteobacteria bacterium]|nr:FkbM family methyltransferase [Betaproteobacteria bacterium]